MSMLDGLRPQCNSSYPDALEICEEEATLLAELCPEDLTLYKSYFIDHWPLKPYFLKRGYGKQYPFFQKNNKKKQPLRIWPGLLAEMLEKHLDFRRFANHHRAYDPDKYNTYIRREDQLFWFALYGAKKTTLECLDIDNKPPGGNKDEHIVGYYRQYNDKDGVLLPVMRCPLDYIKRLKAVYDNFPGRVWCISSETLGFHAWRKLPALTGTQDLYAKRIAKLSALGLAGVEQFPSLGRCLRRPFGSGYRTITQGGVLTDWVDQTRFFHRPGPTPHFNQIIQALEDAQVKQWLAWRHCSADCRQGKVDVEALLEEWKAVLRWLKAPVSLGHDLPQDSPAKVCGPKPARHKPMFDLDAMRHGNWPLALVKLANDGLPASGSIGPVCHELAKWLYWIELYHLPEPEREKEILRLLVEYVKEKHNDTISRWATEAGQNEVCKQVGRNVKMAVNIDRAESLEVFGRIRQKRQQGQYRQLVRLVPILTGQKSGDYSPVPPSSPRQLICVSSLDHPLPEQIEEAIKQEAGRMKVLPFARRLLNLLREKGGSANLNRDDILTQLLGYRNNNQIKKYRQVLVDAGFLKEGAYSAGAFSKLYVLTSKAKKLFAAAKSEQAKEQAG